jgi:prepilin-type processing-associated H-X9-DG protein
VTLPPGVSPNTEAAQKYLTEMGFKMPFNQPGLSIPGPLYQYCQNPDIMHCPGDRRYQMRVSPGYNGPYSWDSYSGTYFLNGEANGAAANYIYKRSTITRPSDKLVWVEGADMSGENQGSWKMDNYGTPGLNYTDAKFHDSPAAFHVTSANFNFCDGHAESHRWLDGSTIAFATSTDPNKDHAGSTIMSDTQSRSTHDQQWVGSHYPGNQNP